MTYVVAQPCFGCKYSDCADVCPVLAFYEGKEMLFIHPDLCIDCGSCVPVCPVGAIYEESDIPHKWKGFIALNAEMAPQCPVIDRKKEFIDW